MTSTEENVLEAGQGEPPSMERVADESANNNGNESNNNNNNNSATDKRSHLDKNGLGSPSHQQQGSGRPPHAPYSNRHQGYPGQYAGYTGSTRPTQQQLQSVVTNSFSAEDERDPSHRGSYPPVPRHVSVSINTEEQQRWGGPPVDDRYPPERLAVNVREVDADGRQQPPTEEPPAPGGKPSIVPPSPARGRFPPLARGSGSGSSFMAPPEPMKRSFWHHSRPGDEYTSSSLPAEFIPPKRTKISPSTQRGGAPAGSPNGMDLRRPPSFFNGSLSWDSRGDEGSYYQGFPPPSRESPRFASDQNRSYHHSYGGAPPPPSHGYHHPHHTSPSPPAQYRDDEYGSMSEHSRPRSMPSTARGHPSYPPPPPVDAIYHHRQNSPSHAAAHHGRRWSHHDSWQQHPSMPSPSSGPRRSPTNYHHGSHSSSPTMQFRDDVESNRCWSHNRERDPLPSPHAHDDHRRLPHFDSNMDQDSVYHSGQSPYHPSHYYGSSMPPLHLKMPPHPQASPVAGGRNLMDPRGHRLGPPDGPPHHDMMDEESRARSGDGDIDDMAGSMDKSASKDGLLLLALPQDKISLSETLCVVRENIEVFKATKSDVDAPAPGRKHAVTVGQVGLRCIHCRHTVRSSDRVKRAVCYPSSIKRIYRTVIDMKLDHFLQCKFVPEELKERLAELKVKHTRSTGTTMQYFIRAANSIGLEDAPQSGVRMNSSKAAARLTEAVPDPMKQSGGKEAAPESVPSEKAEKPEDGSKSDPPALGDSEYRPIKRLDSTSSETSALTPENNAEPGKFFTGKINLALAEDKMALSPLRCFLRSQVCAFSATAEDIAVRAPTTFSITVGQVGIGCIHCVNQPSKLRSNRAVCFPFSISRIYQSVADIQRFHFGECKMLPDDVKAMFLTLQKASSKGSKGLATRQYWITSAKKIGLLDTPRGIRFGRDPSRPEATSMSLDILAQVAFNVTTASRNLVLPDDKPFIAEFLYVVMEQLQPCRFTEADRNKRRLKDVGCIGVECKHCAGQVDGRKFFWSSVNAVESNFVSVHTHMMECRMVPDELKENLGELKKLRKEQTAALKTGSQKAFFSRVWSRLHGDDGKAREGDGETGSSADSTTSSPPMSSGCPSPMMSENEESIVVSGVSDDMKHMSVVEI